jgi:polyhydroxyalkanoate synthesis regulator phasin
MAQVCRVCTHDQHKLADKLIVQGKTNRAIAQKLGVSIDSVYRHRKHVADALVKSYQRHQESSEDELADLMRGLIEDSREVYKRAREYIDNKKIKDIEPRQLAVILKAIDVQGNRIEGLAKLLGRITNSSVTVNQYQLNIVAPRMYEILQNYPQALKEIEEVLRAQN